MSQADETRGGKTVTVISREMTPEEKIAAALAELQEREAAKDPAWKPVVDLRKPGA